MLDRKKESSPEQEKAGEEAREAMEAPDDRSGGSSRRLLLLALLLLVAAGAGFYFHFGGNEAPIAFSAPVREPVSSQPITMPIPTPPAPIAKSEDSEGSEKIPTRQVEDQVAPSETSVNPAPPEAVAEAESAPMEILSVTIPKAALTLQTDPLLLPGEIAQAERILRNLGYEPVRATVEQTVTLTRLRLGVYPSAEALPHLREAQALVSGAFPLRQGEDVAIYAGSFHDLDRARIYADELYEREIRVEEEEAQVNLKVDILRFGAFEGEDEAAEAMEAARSAGLESRVVRLP